MISYRIRQTISRAIVYILLGILALACILPLWVMFANATRSNDQVVNGLSLLPGDYLGRNLETLILGQDRGTGTRGISLNIPQGFLNSLIIATSATALTAYLSAFTAFGFAVYRFRGKPLFWGCILAVMMLPASMSLIGYYKLTAALNMIDTWWPLILPAGANAFGVFFLRQYMVTALPLSLIEAARIDGRSELGIFHAIALPLSLPGIATISILGFLGNWNSYLIPLIVINNQSLYTMPMLIQLLNRHFNGDMGAMYAGVSISVIPIMLIFAFCSRWMIQGVNAGGLKE